MSFDFEISERLRQTLAKLARKDRKLAVAVNKKIRQIINADNSSIEHFKNLRKPLNRFKRVHVGSFVLIFRVKGNTIIFEYFVHHDKAYKR